MTTSDTMSDIEPSAPPPEASDVVIDCTFSDLLDSMEDDVSMSNLTAPLPTLLTPFQSPVHNQCSEESVFRLHPSRNSALEEPMHPSHNTNGASSKTRVSVREEKRKVSPRKKSMSSVIAKKENVKRSSEDEEASSRKKLKDARSGSESTANSNVPPKDRSRLHTIFLSTLCFSSSLKKHSFDQVLRPLVNELTTLADKGVTVVRNGDAITVKGALVAVVADNLAAHAVGGFYESFTSVYPCRFCLVRKSNMKVHFRQQNCCLRTPQTYNRQLDRISKFDRLQSVYGLKRNSCLNRIPHFHVVSGL